MKDLIRGVPVDDDVGRAQAFSGFVGVYLFLLRRYFVTTSDDCGVEMAVLVFRRCVVESIAVALIGGVVTLIGVLASNTRSRAVMELKIDELSRRVEKHNSVVERTYRLEQDMAVVKRDVESLEERMD